MPGPTSEHSAVAMTEGLVARAAGGDVRAFEELLDSRLSRLVRLAAAILGDEADARDAVQQACVHAWTELRRLRSHDRFDAWLGRIVVNECRTALRSRSRRRVREAPVSVLGPSAQHSVSAIPTEGRAPEDRVEMLDELDRALESLDPGARVLLALHHLHDWSVAEIASGSRLSTATVKWRLHRARQDLRRALEANR